jgi:hypothetical protein
VETDERGQQERAEVDSKVNQLQEDAREMYLKVTSPTRTPFLRSI